MNFLQTLFIIIGIITTVFYTLFAPEAFFHHTYNSEHPRIFDRWRDKRIIWNIHQSFIHFLGSLVGFMSLYILIFILGVNNPKEYGIVHLVLFLIGIAGVMGFLPKILFGSSISK